SARRLRPWRSASVASAARIATEAGARSRHRSRAAAAVRSSLPSRAMRVARSARPASSSPAARAASRYQPAASSRRPAWSANSPAMVAPRTSSRSGSAACAGARQAQARQASRPARFTVRRTRWVKTGIEVGRTLEWSIRTGSLSQAPERSRRAGRQPKRMTLYALGINHQTAPVALREQVAFGDGEVPSALAALRALPGVREVALLSTCNRTELYASADDDAA